MFGDEEGQDQTTDTPETEEVGNSQEVETDEQGSGLNPVWDPIRQELGAQFEIIKPHLLEIDKGYNKGITSANEKYKPWEQFANAGITPEVVTQAFATLQNFDQNPEQAYIALRGFLEKEGRLPETPAEVTQAIEDAENEDENLSEEQKRIAELQKQLDGFQTMFTSQQEQQRQQQLDQQATADVEREYTAFDAAHPNLDPALKREVLQRHYMYAASGPQNMKTLEEVFTEVDSLRQSFLSAPRPNDNAPRLPGQGGGVPTTTTKKVEELSRSESQDLLADLVSKASQNQ